MILTEFLFAPTVPSAPRPQNLQLLIPAGVVSGFSSSGSERFVTSSSIPTVKCFFSVFLYAAMIHAGVVSFDARP